jgi:two-component system phosphate regulon response regulator PhoB
MMQPRIMVVEDEEAAQRPARYNLEAEGYRVEVISRGDEAELRLQERVPDLLVLDWMLPGVSGIELCRRLRMRPRPSACPSSC